MAGNGKSILLVDDSKTIRKFMSMIIRMRLGCEIEEAEDGMEAVERIRSRHYDLVITDLNMPRMDGLSLIRMIRNDLGKKVPIIIVSTMGMEEDRDRGLEMGANSFLTKPINGNRMIRTISSMIYCKDVNP